MFLLEFQYSWQRRCGSNIVLFRAEKATPKTGVFELHLFGSHTPGTLFGRSVSAVKKDFERVSDQVKQILDERWV